jgi:hypothetical protein
VSPLRIIGVYDPETINHLISCNIKDITFDLRPMSFNFTQLYKIAEMTQMYKDKLSASIIVSTETATTVKAILEQLRELSGEQDWIVHFSGEEDQQVLTDVAEPFYWTFQEGVNYRPLIKNPLCKRIIFSYEVMAKLQATNEIYPIMQDVMSQKYDDCKIEFLGEWDKSLPNSTLDFFKIKYLSYQIDGSVEKSYRQVDPEMIKQHLTYAGKVLNESFNL